MNVVIDRQQAFGALGARPDRPAIPAASLAEQVRVACFSVSEGRATTNQKISAKVEERIAPIVRFPASSFQSFVAGEEAMEASPVRDVIDCLLDVGDFVAVGQGYVYPTAPRIVSLGGEYDLLISGGPSFALRNRIAAGGPICLIRAIPTGGATGLPAQSLANWLGAPSLELEAWTREQFQQVLPKIVTDASHWKVAALDRGEWSWQPADAMPHTNGVVLCQEPKEPGPGNRWLLARLRKGPSGVSTTEALELPKGTGHRLLHGLHLQAEQFRRVVIKVESQHFSLRMSRFALPEVLRFLRAVSFDILEEANNRLHFTIAREFHRTVEQLLSRYAFRLIPYGN